MRYQRLLEPDRFPREGYPYIDADTGYTLYGKTTEALVAVATLHRKSNGLPIPDNFAFIVETQVCRQHPGRCVNRDGTPPDISCRHRGEVTRLEGCETCGGVWAKIQKCALFGECSQFSKDVGVQRCGLCRSRVSELPEGEQ